MTTRDRVRGRFTMFHRVLVVFAITVLVSFWLAVMDEGRVAVLLPGFAMLAVSAYLLLRVVFQPLFKLERTMIRAEHGDYPVDETVTSDLGQLSRAVNAVVNRLARGRQYLSSRVLRALDEERKRIARELHDETSQSLTTLILNIDMALAALDSPVQEQKVRDILSRTRSLTLFTLEEIRKLIFDLRPTILDDLGLVPAVRWYAMNKMEPLGVVISFEIQGLDRRLSPDLETAVFRVVQEAITNIIKHAGASRVDITLKANDEVVMAGVRDDGCGFDFGREVEGTPAEKRGLGLFGMEERVRLLGGEFNVISRPRRGTEVKVKIPRSSAARRDAVRVD